VKERRATRIRIRVDEDPAPKKKRRRNSGGKKKNDDFNSASYSDERPQATTNFPSVLFAQSTKA
jgi:hypothetical protein